MFLSLRRKKITQVQLAKQETKDMNVHDVGDTNLMNSIININQIKEIMTYTKYNVSLSYMDLGSGVVCCVQMRDPSNSQV